MSHQDQLDLAIDLYDGGEAAKARAILEVLRRRFPGDEAVAYTLGTIHHREGSLADARALLEDAVRAAPGRAEFRLGLARLCQDAGALADAVRAFEAALELDPGLSEAGSGLAVCLAGLGRLEDALARMEDAVAGAPADPTLRAGYGRLFLDAGRDDAAREQFRKGLAARPRHGRCLYNLVKLEANSGALDQAIALARDVEDLSPDGTFRAGIACAVLPMVPESAAEMERAQAAYGRSIRGLAAAHCRVDARSVLAAGTNFTAAYHAMDDRETQETIAGFYLRNCPELAFRAPRPGNGRAGRKRIRVGFVSTHFYNHTIAKLYRGIIATLDRARFQVLVFSTRAPEDELGRYLEHVSDEFVVIPERLYPARDALAGAALDILFYTDIGMASLTYFLAFARLAPVQCVGWGHLVSTGIPSVDYFISAMDLENADPGLAQAQYSERLIRLTHPPTYLFATDPGAEAPAPDLAFAKGKHLYACPQPLFKIHPDFDTLLLQILERDADGVLAFIDSHGAWSATLRRRWEAQAPDLARRIHFVPRMRQDGFLKLLQASHCILDSLYVSGGMSSAETLGVGKAVVTLPHASRAVGRVTYGYYRQIGVTECIAQSPADYVAIALRLGTDPQWRSEIETKIRAHAHLLHERKEVIHELEAFFERALARRPTGAPADSISIPE